MKWQLHEEIVLGGLATTSTASRSTALSSAIVALLRHLAKLGCFLAALRPLSLLLILFSLLDELEHAQWHGHLLLDLELESLHVAHHLVDLFKDLLPFLLILSLGLLVLTAVPGRRGIEE